MRSVFTTLRDLTLKTYDTLARHRHRQTLLDSILVIAVICDLVASLVELIQLEEWKRGHFGFWLWLGARFQNELRSYFTLVLTVFGGHKFFAEWPHSDYLRLFLDLVGTFEVDSRTFRNTLRCAVGGAGSLWILFLVYWLTDQALGPDFRRNDRPMLAILHCMPLCGNVGESSLGKAPFGGFAYRPQTYSRLFLLWTALRRQVRA